MSDYLRMTRDDYAAVRRASGMHTFEGSSGHFRRFLVETLRPSHAALAAWVDGLSKKHVRIMRVHLQGEAAASPA